MRFLAALAVALCIAVSPALAAEPAALAKARQRYNAGDFEGAISAAAVARNIPSSADAASLVIARAHLEWYRQRADPADLVTASGSGVDPHISVANARLQADRVADERGLATDEVLALIDEHTTSRSLGFLGERGVNVLQLNLALDAIGRS